MLSSSSAGPSRLSSRHASRTTPPLSSYGSSYPTNGTRPRQSSNLSPNPGSPSESSFHLTSLPKIPCERGECLIPDSKTFFCAYCDASFCDTCWGQERPHKPGKVAPDGLPHEKADPQVVNRLKETFAPTSDPLIQRQQHINDEETAWFGIERNLKGDPIFQDYGRFATLLANSASGEHVTRYPQLVSFIGQTGAGKSTIVKMLIEQQASECEVSDPSVFPRPIVGSARNDNTPTSGDVHLYADPATYTQALPLLYADCEGLEGSEAVPIGNRHKESDLNVQYSSKKRADGNDERKRNKIKKPKIARGQQREITWANSPETKKRQFAVEELYPRLLYTFSDVIVFVLQNAKTFEATVLNRLLTWAHASMEKSVNQPTLPHAIIALNATDMNVDGQEWNPDYATNILMKSVAGALRRDAQYQEYANYFIERGKVINTMHDLLLCYYSSVRVVRIPKKDGRYMIIDQQVAKLREEIKRGCKSSYFTKRRARMLSNSNELHVYLQYAFDHFSQNLNTPFNFIDVAFKNNPIPQDFGGSILKLAASMKGTDGRAIFRELSNMVASCIMLDCARHELRGRIEELLTQYYMDHCDNALDDFCRLFWRCEYSDGKDRCVNVRDGHRKGHQNDTGKIIGSGPYESAFSWETFKDEWMELLMGAIKKLQDERHASLNANSIQHEPAAEKPCASRIHKFELQQFYSRVGGAHLYKSHAACFCCLREPPEHPLPCGHVLCSPCVLAYGRHERGPVIEMTNCPLHERECRFDPPWVIKFKPALAGVRILTLDGGGIRGIVELEALRAIENQLEVKIPLHRFFDMIVGTSTGGIIALGLGVQHWRIQDCMEKFTTLARKAFAGRLANITLPSKYKTKDLVEALEAVFPKQNLFGGRHPYANSYHTKVIVTSTTETGDHPVILTNYNRQPVEQPSYTLVRPDNHRHELTLTEAAQATSAAPSFFKPFVNPRTHEGYLDGALFHNNPIRVAYRESKLLWPEVAELHPDILLSVGTGHHGQTTRGVAEVLATRRERRDSASRSSLSSETNPAPKSKGRFATRLKNTWLGQMFTLAVNRLDNILNAEQIWQDFRNEVLIDGCPAEDRSRFQRLNPNLGFQPPKLDAKDKLGEVAHAAYRNLKDSPKYRQQISRIVQRLIASSFYFDKEKDAEPIEGGGYKLLGKIRCRFLNGSDEMRELGKFFRKQQTENFRPFFRIYEVGRQDPGVQKYLDKSKIESMISTAHFEMGIIAIRVSEEMSSTYIGLQLWDREIGKTELLPISGFPSRVVRNSIPKVPTRDPTPERPIIRSRRSSRHPRASAGSIDGVLLGSGARNHVRSRSNTSSASDNSREAGFDHDWLSRRERAARSPQSSFQLPLEPLSPGTSSPLISFSPPTSPRPSSPLYGTGYNPVFHVEDDDESQMALAIEMSLKEQENAEIAAMNKRYTSNGTDLDELDVAMERSRFDR